MNISLDELLKRAFKNDEGNHFPEHEFEAIDFMKGLIDSLQEEGKLSKDEADIYLKRIEEWEDNNKEDY